MTLLRMLCVAGCAGSLLAQTPVALANWTVENFAGTPIGNWTVAASGLSVTQSVNGVPTVFYGDTPIHNRRLEGQITVSGSDDDMVGFVLGFQPGDSTNPNADYLLLDWKRATQNYNFGAPACTPGSTALAGLALSRVHGVPTMDELWGHVDLNTSPCSTANDFVLELQRGATLGSTGWVRNQTYTFRIDYTPTRVKVYVDTVLQIDVQGSFPDGRIGFYNFSQAGVTYNAFTSDCVASWSNYGVGFPGTAGVPTLVAGGEPQLGTAVALRMSNVAPTPQLGFLVFGYLRQNLPTGFGGALLVQPLSGETLPLPVAPGVGVRNLVIPLDAAFCGILVHVQGAHLDAGSASGIAFTPGLTLALGN